MLGAMLNVAKSDTKNNGENQEDNYLEGSSESTVSKKKPTALERRRKTIMDGIAPFLHLCLQYGS